jgi:8-oxo-dGTP diphosphatase
VTEPQKHTVDALLLLTRGNEVLLALRQGTGFADGQWNLPSGKVDRGENVVAAVIREAREEVGAHLREDEINCVATVHCRNSETDVRIGVFFQAEMHETHNCSPRNAEPHKCAKIAWYPMDMLPSNIMRYSALGVSLYQRGECFGLIGW